MESVIKILIAEHDKHDLEMIKSELKRSGVDHVTENVANEKGYRKALTNFIPDIILCDYGFPSFDGPAAFKIREEIAPETPFILVSGTIGEESSIELIRNGVTDFVLKDKMFTLNTKLVRALKEAKERKDKNKTEQDLQKSKARLVKAQAIAKIGSWETCLNDLHVQWSDETYKIFGVDPLDFQLTHAAFIQLIHPDDVEAVDLAFQSSHNSKSVNVIEHRIVTPAGLIKCVEECWQITFDESGNPVTAVGTCQDITERKKNEAAVNKAYVEKNMVLESIDDGFFALDENSIVTYWNKRAEILLDTKKEDLIGKNLHEVFLARGSSIFYENYLKALREKTTIYFEGYSNLSRKWFAVSAYGSDNGLSVFFKDVTARKNDEERIKESESRYRSLVEQATDTICIVDASMKFIEVNPSGCLMFGYSKEEILELFINDVLFEEDLLINPIKIGELRAGITTNSERRVKRKDGTATTVELNAKMLEDGRIMVFGRDITERKESERLIQESEAKFRSFFENSMDGMLLTVTDGEIVAANPAVCDIFGMTEEEICAVGRFGLVDFDDPRVNILLEERQRTGSARGELSLVRKDGSKFQAELTSAMFTDSFGKQRTSMIIRDITERKAIEFSLNQTSEELQHALKDLNKIMDSSMDMICTVNEAGRFVQMSAASMAILGYSPQEMININYIDLVHPDDVEKSLEKNTEIKNGLLVTMFENRYIHKNGSAVPMLWSANWDKNDKLMYCIAKDATEKKRLEKAFAIERERFLGLYLQAPSCMGILKGPDHVYEMANPLYLKLIDKTDIIGKTVNEVLPELEGQGILELLDNVYKTGDSFSANEMLLKFDFKGNGELVDTYLNFIYQAHRNNEGNIDGILFFVIDVTEQVLSRRKIEESGKRYRQIVETAQEGIWLIDENHKTTFVNSKMCEILEYTEAEMMGKEIYFFMDEEGKKIAADLMVLKKEGHYSRAHFKYISKSGNEVWTNLSANPLFDEDGVYKGSLGMVTDITESKKAERRDQFQATLLNTIGQATIATDMQGNINFWNKAASAIYGWTEEEVLGKSILTITPAQQSKEQGEEIVQELMRGNSWSGEFMVRRKDGTEFPAFVTSSPIYDQQQQLLGIIGVSSDITRRKEAELRLRESNERYNLVSQATNDMVWDWDLSTGKVYRNKEGWKKIFRTGDKEVDNEMITDWDNRVHPEDRDVVKHIENEILKSERDFFEVECRVMRDDGTYAYIHDRGNIFRNEQGKAIRLIGATQDITERKMAELALRFTLAEKNTILESIGDAFFALDENWTVSYWNKHAEKLLGVTKEEIVGRNLWDVFKDSIDSESYIRYNEAIATNESIQFEDFYPPLSKWFEISAYPSEKGLAVYFKDVTERKHSEIKLDELNANLKLRAKELAISNLELEQFAYVTSHDLQEPLRMVTSFLTKLEEKYGAVIDDKGRQYIHFAVDGARRMRQIILDLLEFSRVGRTEDKLEEIDLNELVEEIKILFRKQIVEKNAAICSDNLPRVEGFRSPLRQVFQNLISNGLKFIGIDRAAQINISCTEFNDHWQFAVHDNGIGIEQEYFDKIFIIFQRLHHKDEFPGTGLGLAITKKIIENHGGKIWVESGGKTGSTFYFTIRKR